MMKIHEETSEPQFNQSPALCRKAIKQHIEIKVEVTILMTI